MAKGKPTSGKRQPGGGRKKDLDVTKQVLALDLIQRTENKPLKTIVKATSVRSAMPVNKTQHARAQRRHEAQVNAHKRQVKRRRMEWWGGSPNHHPGYAEVRAEVDRLLDVPLCAGCSELPYWRLHWHCAVCGRPDEEGAPARPLGRLDSADESSRWPNFNIHFAGYVCQDCAFLSNAERAAKRSEVIAATTEMGRAGRPLMIRLAAALRCLAVEMVARDASATIRSSG
jgi:hypothetical protein